MNLRLTSSTGRAAARLTALFVALVLPCAALAQKLDRSKLEKAANRSALAARVLETVVNFRGETIPRPLLERARAVGVFPDLDRMNIVMPNSRLAYGVISSRRPEGWSPPAYYGFGAPKIPDLSWRGKKLPDVVVLFMTDQALSKLDQGKFDFIDEWVGHAGPVGDLTPEKEEGVRAAHALVYALVDGRVEGVRVDAGANGGGAVNPDNNINNAVYGIKGREVLAGKAPLWPAEVLPALSVYPNMLSSLMKR